MSTVNVAITRFEKIDMMSCRLSRSKLSLGSPDSARHPGIRSPEAMDHGCGQSS